MHEIPRGSGPSSLKLDSNPKLTGEAAASDLAAAGKFPKLTKMTRLFWK
jgi:hypothetical protein